uniref:Putative ovule protein n=1 Tax=Solanum chacoense TaxID=4108 RepID=A0A0V0HLD6_SOLCH
MGKRKKKEAYQTLTPKFNTRLELQNLHCWNFLLSQGTIYFHNGESPGLMVHSLKHFKTQG